MGRVDVIVSIDNGWLGDFVVCTAALQRRAVYIGGQRIAEDA